MFDINALKKCYIYNVKNCSKQSSISDNSDFLFNFKSFSYNSLSSNQENTSKTTKNNTSYNTSKFNYSSILKNMRSKISTILASKTTTKVEEKNTNSEAEVKTDSKQEDVKQETTSKTTSLDINGEIDESIKQGSTGDCWILSSLLAISSTEKGKNLIKNSVTVNSDNTVTVSFKGINKSYTVSTDEISKYDTDSNLCDSMSNGDNDALVYEIAVAKLRQDLANGKVTTDKSFANYNNGNVSDYSTAIEGGYDVSMLYYLTGKTPTAIKLNSDKKTTYTALNYILNNVDTENAAIVVDLKDGSSSANCIDGSKYDLTIDGTHSIAIKNLTKSTVTILDSWDTSNEYTMTWEEFAGLNLSQIAYTSLA